MIPWYTKSVLPEMMAFDSIEKCWAEEGAKGESTLHVLLRNKVSDHEVTTEDAESSVENEEKPQLTLLTYLLKYAECSLVKHVDVSEKLQDLFGAKMTVRYEQRLLVARFGNETDRCRFAQDVRSPIGSFRGKFLLPRNLIPMRNKSQRWIYLLNTQENTMEIRDAETGDVKVSSVNNAEIERGIGSGVSAISRVDMEYVNHFEADDFSFVLTRASGNISDLVFTDFFNAYKWTSRLSRSWSAGDVNTAWKYL